MAPVHREITGEGEPAEVFIMRIGTGPRTSTAKAPIRSEPEYADRVSRVIDACLSCGEETAAGSALFSDRRRVEQPGAAPVFVCEACGARIAAERGQTRLTDEELRRFVEDGSAAIATWNR